MDPFIRISVFIAKLSERQYCWRVFEDFHSQQYVQLFDIHCGLFMRLHFTISGYDYRRTARFRQSTISASLKSFLLITCIDAPESTTNSRSSDLRVDASKHLFFEGEKNVALSCSFNLNALLASFHAASRGTLLLPFRLPLRTILLESWSCAYEVHLGKNVISEQRILVSNFTRWIGFCMSELFRRIDFGGVMSTQPNCRALDDRR